MGTWYVILVLACAGTIFLSYRRAAAVEEKVQRVLREFQRLGEYVDEMQKALEGSVDQLRAEIADKMVPRK